MAQNPLTPIIIPPGSEGEASHFGRFTHHNPLTPDAWPAPGGGRTIVWAGWFNDDADLARGRFPRDLSTWTEPGWSALRDGLARLGTRAHDAGGTVCVRTAAGCVLGDPQACLTFFREADHPGIELLVDLPSMITPEMLPEMEDHAARAFAALGTLEAAVGSVLAAPVADGGGGIRLGSLSEHPEAAKTLLAAWNDSPLASRPALVIDPRDAAMLA